MPVARSREFYTPRTRSKFTTIDELRVEEGKGKKVLSVKVYFIFIVTTVSLLFAVLYQAFKPRLLVALVSFKSPLVTKRLPIFNPEFVCLFVCFFHRSFFSVLGMYASSNQ